MKYDKIKFWSYLSLPPLSSCFDSNLVQFQIIQQWLAYAVRLESSEAGNTINQTQIRKRYGLYNAFNNSSKNTARNFSDYNQQTICL